MGETPGDLQRRLRLERAAHDLRQTPAPIAAIAFDAGYMSLEGFSRAFRRAYGELPSQFRKRLGADVALHGASLVHYDAQTRKLRTIQSKGEHPMDLVDRLLDNDYRAKRGLLTSALALTDAQLDATFFCQIQQVPWADPDKNLRETLNRMIDMGWWVSELFSSIGWASAADEASREKAHTITEMIARLDHFHTLYSPFVEYVKENNLWETTWVDSACEPPETFTYASLIESGLERGIFRRWMARQQLAQVGVQDGLW